MRAHSSKLAEFGRFQPLTFGTRLCRKESGGPGPPSPRLRRTYSMLNMGEMKSIRRSFSEGGWWARQDSNLQPDRYERPALTS